MDGTSRMEVSFGAVVGIGVAGINAAEYCERAFSRETWRRDSSVYVTGVLLISSLGFSKGSRI